MKISFRQTKLKLVILLSISFIKGYSTPQVGVQYHRRYRGLEQKCVRRHIGSIFPHHHFGHNTVLYVEQSQRCSKVESRRPHPHDSSRQSRYSHIVSIGEKRSAIRGQNGPIAGRKSSQMSSEARENVLPTHGVRPGDC